MAKAFLFGIGGGNAGTSLILVNFYNGETIIKSQFIEKAEELVAPANPTLESTEQYDYTFLGWSLDGINVISSWLAPVASKEVNYYAVFEQKARLDTIGNMSSYSLLELNPISISEFV